MAPKRPTDATPNASLDEAEVIAYLRAHPEFLRNHPDLLETLTPPEKQTGDNIVDFQRFALGSLQQDMQALKDRFNDLVMNARDQQSAQHQVLKAIMPLLRARDLEELLEVLTIDLVRHFHIDAVRLVIESEMAELYETYYGEESYSGIGFAPMQTVDLAIGLSRNVALVPDCATNPPHAFEMIFVDCVALIKSCALLRVYLERIDRYGLIALGSRQTSRFQAGQGLELLHFLAEVIEWRLDQCLREHEIEKLR